MIMFFVIMSTAAFMVVVMVMMFMFFVIMSTAMNAVADMIIMTITIITQMRYFRRLP